jgi:hypothetical protein
MREQLSLADVPNKEVQPKLALPRVVQPSRDDRPASCLSLTTRFSAVEMADHLF